MNENSSQNEFLLILQHYLSTNEEERRQSLLFIEQCRKKNVIFLIQNLFFFLSQSNCPSNLKQLIIIISFNTIYRLTPPSFFISRFEFLNSSCPQLIEQFLSLSILNFQEFPILSGHLFSSIAEIIYDFSEDNQILSGLFQKLNENKDINFIEASLIAIKDLSPYYVENPNLYNAILQLICGYIQSTSYSIKSKIYSFQILSIIIPAISIETAEQLSVILNSIKIGLETEDLKPYSYQCVKELIKYQILVFNRYSNEFIQIINADLISSCKTLNEQLIYSLCSLIKALTVTKIDEELELCRALLLSNSFPFFITSLLTISLANPSIEPNNAEDSNIFIEAFHTISRIIESIPDVSLPPLFEYTVNNIWPTSIESPQVLNAQEVSCNFLSLTISFGGIDMIQQLVLMITNQYCSVYSFTFTQEVNFNTALTFITLSLLKNQSSKIKDAALSLCFSLFYRKDLSEYVNHTSIFLSILQELIGIIENSSVMSLRESSCEVIAFFIQEYVTINRIEIDLPSLLSICLNHINEDNLSFIRSLFTLINIIIQKLNLDQLGLVVPHLFELVASSFSDSRISHNLDEILFMFKVICERIMSIDKSLNPEAIILPFLDNFYKLFTDNWTTSFNSTILNSIAYLGAASTYEHFYPYLESFLQILLGNPSDSSLLDFSDIIRFFIEKSDFDLVPFLPVLKDFAIQKVQDNIQTNLSGSISLIRLISTFVKRYFDQISADLKALLEMFSQIVNSIKSINDPDIQIDLIIEISVFFTHLLEALRKCSIDLSPILQICYLQALNISNFIDVEEFDDNDIILVKIVLFLIQLLNCDVQQFNQFVLAQSEFRDFLISLTKVKEIEALVAHLLKSVGIVPTDDFSDP